MRPTFIGIGAQKCASTWIYEMLGGHPQVCVSAAKELDFFSYHYENGFRWYESQFPVRPGVLHAGEVSPSYLHEPGVCERVRAWVPDAVILVSLRDPVERALSQHRHMVRIGRVPGDDLSFETALASNPTYVEQGDYHRHLVRWIDAFGRSRVHIVLMDDIRREAGSVIRSLYDFLSIDTAHHPTSANEARNRSHVVRSPVTQRAVHLVRDAAHAVGAGSVWRSLGDLGLRRAYRAANWTDSSDVIPDPQPETLGRLRGHFRPGVERLSELLQRDLGEWLR